MSKYTFKDLCSIKTGKLDANAAVENGTYPFFTCSKEPLKIDTYAYDCDCILLAGNGEFNVNIYSGKFNAYQRTYIIQVNDPERTSLKYLFYLLKHSVAHLKSVSTGGVIRFIKLGNIQSITVPETNIKMQHKISMTLDRLQNAIELKKQQLSSLDELVKSRFIEMFGDIDLSPQKSEWTKLSDLGTIYTGTTPSTGDETNWDGSILWITPAEMNDESFFIDNTIRKITEKGMKSKSLSLMPVGTVLLSTRAPIGKVGIVAKPMTCNQGFKNFYCPNKLNCIFLYVVLKNNTQYLNAIGTGTTFKEISKTTCGNIRVPVPPIELQNEFAEFVKLIDKSKFIVQQQIKDLQELLDSKMDEYFR